MSILNFVALLVESMAWPVVVLAGIVLLRDKVAESSFRGLKRLKAGPVELELFEREVSVTRALVANSAEATAAEGEADAEAAMGSPDGPLAYPVSSIEAVLRSHLLVRRAVVTLLGCNEDLLVDPRVSLVNLADRAHQAELISADLRMGIRNLENLKDAALEITSSGMSLPYRVAADFVNVAESVERSIETRPSQPR